MNKTVQLYFNKDIIKKVLESGVYKNFEFFICYNLS